MKKGKKIFAFLLSFCILIPVSSLQAGAADGSVDPGVYSAPVRLLHASLDQDSMGNEAMVQTGTIRVSGEGTALELDFQPMQFMSMTGYLYELKKVDMSSVQYNEYGYPDTYTAQDAQILEKYTDTYDLFNDSTSEYYDEKTKGGWYPKKVSIPVKTGDTEFYVEIYVPVMESIGAGQGTKVARLSIDWNNLALQQGTAADKTALNVLIQSAQTESGRTGTYTAETLEKLRTAIANAQAIAEKETAAQAEVDAQIAALNAAIQALERQPAVTPVPNPEPSLTPAVTPTPSPEPSATPVVTPTPSPEPSATPSVTPTPSPEPSATPAVTPTPSPKPSATPAVKPAKVTGVKAKNPKRKTAALSWKKVSKASGYEVYRSVKKTAGFQKVTTIKKNTTVKYTDKKLKKGKTYYYKIRAYRTVEGKKIYAPYSSPVKVKIKQ